MQDPNDNVPYVPDEYSPPPPKRKMSGWLIVLIVILVLIAACCLCILLGVLLLAPITGTTFSTIIRTIEVFTPVP